MSTANLLGSYLDKRVHVVTMDGRSYHGLLHNYDQVANIVLQGAEEQIVEPGAAVVRKEERGSLVIRGDTIAIIGDIDADIERKLELNDVPIPGVIPPFR